MVKKYKAQIQYLVDDEDILRKSEFMIEVKMLQAEEGDCFLVYIEDNGKKYNILIDGGTEETYEEVLKDELQKIFDRGEVIDLIIITHICSDHLDGVKAFFGDEKEETKNKVKEIWFNSASVIANHLDENIEKVDEREHQINLSTTKKISKVTGYTLERYLTELGYNLEIITNKTDCKYLDGNENIKFTFLSPTRKNLEELNNKWPSKELSKKISGVQNVEYMRSIDELIEDDYKYLDGNLTSKGKDKNEHNGASIAFILEYKDKKIMFLGDSYDDVIIESIREKKLNTPLKIDYMKVSHHGSKNNISPALLKMVDCKNFLISTDGINQRNGHPNKRSLARIIKYSKTPVNFYFNYDIKKKIFPNNFKEEKEKHKFECCILKKGENIPW